MKKRFIDFLMNNPKKSLLGLLLSLILFLPGILSIKEDFTYSIWYNNDDNLMELFRDFQKKFGNDDQAIIGIYRPEGVFKTEHLEFIKNLVTELQSLKDIVRVEAITNANIVHSYEDELVIEPLYEDKRDSLEQMKSLALNDEAIVDVNVNQTADFATIALTSRPDFVSVPDYYSMTQAINRVLQKYEDQGVKFYWAGSIVLTYWFKQITLDDMNILAPLALFMFVVLLWFFYRRMAGLYIPLFIIIVSVIMMTGCAGYLGHTLNTISSAAPTILLTVALADAVHLLTYFFYALNRGATNEDAVRRSLEKNFYPTLITSLTTFLGFVSFATSQVVPIADLGMEVGLGVLIAWIVSYFIFSSVILIFPLKAREKEKTKIDRWKDQKTKILKSLIARKNMILGGSLVFALIALSIVSQLYVSMDPIKQFSETHEVPKDFYFIEDKMKSASTLEVMISHSDVYEVEFLKSVERFDNWLQDKDFVHKSTSVINIIKKLNQNMHAGDEKFYQLPDSKEKVAQLMLLYSLGLPQGQNIEHWVSLEKDAMRVTVFWNVHNSKEALEIIDEINTYGKENGLDLKVTGKMPLFHNLTPYVVNTFFVSFGTALVLITIIMILVLGSIKLGLLTLIPNIIPLLMGGVIVYFAKFQVDIGIVIVASVCLGIAVDDSIHILFEYRRHRSSGKNLLESFQIIFENTLPALFITTLIIALGFGTFLFAQYLPNSRFGVLVAVILCFAFVADAMLFPVIMGIFDKYVRKNES